MKALKSEVAKQKDQISILEVRSSEFDELKTEFKSQKSLLAKLLLEVDSNEDTIWQLRSTNANLDKELRAAKNEAGMIRDLKIRVEAFEIEKAKAVQGLNAELEELRLKAKITKAEMEVELSKARLKQLENDEMFKEKFSKQQSIIANLENQLRAAETGLEAQNSNVECLEAKSKASEASAALPLIGDLMLGSSSSGKRRLSGSDESNVVKKRSFSGEVRMSTRFCLGTFGPSLVFAAPDARLKIIVTLETSLDLA